ncbi:MAG TPA: M14 metallopeptidase family protein [Longimicrobiales bacterium]|nr:M14 metallopeptidase family protein [Longimicrobiales bacterium]
MRASLLLLLALVAAPRPTSAQHALGGAGPYDPAVPTPRAVLGYALGERFTPHHLIVRYAEAVAAASPRVRVDTVAHSFEGRALLEIAVSSAASMARLDEIRADAARLADPRGASEAALDRAVAATPAIVWLGYTVHGNEASGVEAALATLYQLAAGQDDETRMILDSTVVLIDPVQNPDGHERHAQDMMRRRGLFGPDPYPGAMDHRGEWPGARTSHYLFDLNRDWFLHTHPETRGRMRTFALWHPHVAVDLHEMGSGSTYFFAPPMEPVNRNVDPSIIAWWSVFARGNADALARHGWGFFTREGYDEFWPGYGVSWPSLIGAVGMTYEQASSGAGAIRREDGSVLTLREAAAHHYVASMATLRTAASRRTARVRDYLEYRRRAVREHARAPLRTILLAPDAQGRADSLAAVLLSNRIEVGRLARPIELRATAYGEREARTVRLPAGAHVIDLAQPQGRLAKAILEPDAVLDSAFIREELERRRTGRSDRFYDVTAWALPYAYRVPAWWTGAEVGPVVPVTRPRDDDVAAPPDRAGYAYVFAPGSHASLRMLAGLLVDSVRLRHARYGFRVGADAFPGGAFVALVNRNEGTLHETVRRRAGETGARVVAVHNALVDEGTDLGSNSVRPIPAPRIALVGGDGTSSYSFGASWYTFEQLLGFPVTRVAMADLTAALAHFNVVVLPSASGIGGRLGDGGTDALQRWVRGGGVLVTLDGATAWLASEESGLSRLRPLEDTASAGDGAPLPASTPGAIVRAVADTLSPLMAGVSDAEVPVLLSGDRAYRAPADLRPGEAVMRYAALPRLRLAGYLWPEAPARVAGTPYLWTERVGRGRVIAFAGDPTFRAMYRGLLPLFANAVFLGGSF